MCNFRQQASLWSLHLFYMRVWQENFTRHEKDGEFYLSLFCWLHSNAAQFECQLFLIKMLFCTRVSYVKLLHYKNLLQFEIKLKKRIDNTVQFVIHNSYYKMAYSLLRSIGISLINKAICVGSWNEIVVRLLEASLYPGNILFHCKHLHSLTRETAPHVSNNV